VFNEWLVIRHGTLITPHQEIRDGCLIACNGKILAADECEQLREVPAGAVIVDATDSFVVPGFIDIHVHGSYGSEVLEATPNAFEIMSRFFVTRGVTGFVATAASSPCPQLLQVLTLARTLLAGEPLPGAQLLGVHLEGPFLSAHQRGAHAEEHLRLPLPGLYEEFLSFNDVLRMVTLAPELEGAVMLIRALCQAGIVAAAGHTDALERDITPAIDAGLSHAVHCFCNMSTLRRDNLRRVAGVVETVLADDRLTTELIADGWHVGDSLMRLAVKVKGADRVCLVTDAMKAGGLPAGRYSVGGRDVIVSEGVARLPDLSAYAGSATTLDVCVQNAVRRIGLPLHESVRMATLTPATIVGVEDSKGALEPGKDADIVLLDRQLNVRAAFVGGQPRFQAPGAQLFPTANALPVRLTEV
jgi:N-acetylglucosamine-6-phosphate deacetylase